jgi:hypothetical protein
MYNERREQEPSIGCPLSPLAWGMAILPEGTTEGKSAFIHTRWVIRTYFFPGEGALQTTARYRTLPLERPQAPFLGHTGA